MKPTSLFLGIVLLLLCAPVVHADGDDQDQLQASPPTESDLETPFQWVDLKQPGGVKKVINKIFHVKGKPVAPPPPIQGAPKPAVPRALGDFFAIDKAASEPPIPEAKPLITTTGACQADAVEFDPCPNSWFFTAPGLAKNRMGMSQAAIAERDHLFALASLAVVNEDWQFSPDDAKANAEVANLPRRGHNIGGVLVDDRGKLVWWERNSNGIECSGTNHGETRMMISYLKFSRRSTLGCHSIYTSLEPCAMCSGMMVQQKIARTIYVEKDHGFGAALERLHQPFGPRNFPCGFPRAPFSRHAEDVAAAKDLDVKFHDFMKKTGNDDLTSFLQTKEAHDTYQAAEDELLAFKPMDENKGTLADIKTMIADLRSKIYHRANVSVEQHVQIERSRRAQQVNVNLPRLGLPLDVDPCCRPPLMNNLGRLNQQAPLSPACKAESPTLSPVPQLQ
jgi:tRNA(Arg) A34 adenosine deaminase TadA